MLEKQNQERDTEKMASHYKQQSHFSVRVVAKRRCSGLV